MLFSNTIQNTIDNSCSTTLSNIDLTEGYISIEFVVNFRKLECRVIKLLPVINVWLTSLSR